jgi:hypothetical protein
LFAGSSGVDFYIEEGTMTQNPRTVARTARVLLGVLAAGVLTAGTMLSPVAAFASPSGQSKTVAPLDASSPGDLSATGTMPGTNLLCTSHYRWQVVTSLGGTNYSQVEWTSNPCGAKIQERSECQLGITQWVTSGQVLRTYLWDRSTCPNSFAIIEADVRFNFGGGWGAYQEFWPAV